MSVNQNLKKSPRKCKRLHINLTETQMNHIDKARKHLNRSEFVVKCIEACVGITYGMAEEVIFADLAPHVCGMCSTKTKPGVYITSSVGDRLFVCNDCVVEW